MCCLPVILLLRSHRPNNFSDQTFEFSAIIGRTYVRRQAIRKNCIKNGHEKAPRSWYVQGMTKQKTKNAKNAKIETDRRPFADVPRRWLTIAVVVGGMIGLLLSQVFHWTDVQTFVVTLIIAGLCAALSAVLYRATHR